MQIFVCCLYQVMNKKAREDAKEKTREKKPEKKEKSRPNSGKGPTQNIDIELPTVINLSTQVDFVDSFVYLGDILYGIHLISALRCTCEDSFNYGDTLKRRVGPPLVGSKPFANMADKKGSREAGSKGETAKGDQRKQQKFAERKQPTEVGGNKRPKIGRA